MVEQGRRAIDVIARETGFGSRDRMRRAFIRRFGQAPQEIRRDVRANLRAASGGTDGIAGQYL
jgi:transcriptional regulator GlxA family with amidase domain